MMPAFTTYWTGLDDGTLSDAGKVGITDTSGVFTSTNVDGALDEVAAFMDARVGIRPANTATSYWMVPSITGSATSNAALPSQGEMYMQRFIVAKTVTLTSVNVEVTTAGESGATIRAGIYSDSTSGEHDMTDIALVVDLGTAAADSTGMKSITGSQSLAPGSYWVGVVPQSCPSTAPKFRGLFDNFTAPGVPGFFSTITYGAGAVRVTGITGALPDPPTAFQESALGGRRAVVVRIGVAA